MSRQESQGKPPVQVRELTAEEFDRPRSGALRVDVQVREPEGMTSKSEQNASA